MNDERLMGEVTYLGSIIGEYGFRAILRDENPESDCAGILGTPRVGPTRSGLSIEDYCDASIDRLLTGLLEGGTTRDRIVETIPQAPDERQGLERIKRRRNRLCLTP